MLERLVNGASKLVLDKAVNKINDPFDASISLMPSKKVFSSLASQKEKIADNFSKAAGSYDKHADLQRRVGQKAMALSIEQLNNKTVNNIVDLGCGTAQAASKLSLYCQHWIGLDISSNMLNVALQENDSKSANCVFSAVNADAEDLPFSSSSLSFVYSSMALQWCKQPKQVINEIERVLEVNGKAVLAIVSGESFSDLHAAWHVQGLPSRLSQFHSKTTWLEALTQTSFDVTCSEMAFYTHHRSVLDMLKSIKSIGGNTLVQPSSNDTCDLPNQYFSKRELKQVQHYLAHKQNLTTNGQSLAEPKAFCLEYKILFLELHKPQRKI